jgi:hypothetical protein
MCIVRARHVVHTTRLRRLTEVFCFVRCGRSTFVRCGRKTTNLKPQKLVSSVVSCSAVSCQRNFGGDSTTCSQKFPYHQPWEKVIAFKRHKRRESATKRRWERATKRGKQQPTRPKKMPPQKCVCYMSSDVHDQFPTPSPVSTRCSKKS